MITDLIFSSKRDISGNGRIEDSGLTGLIKQTFAALTISQGIDGGIRLIQQSNDRDRFRLCFDSNADFGVYRKGDVYTAPENIASFERSEFEDFLDNPHVSQRRLQEFVRRLSIGQLDRYDPQPFR